MSSTTLTKSLERWVGSTLNAPDSPGREHCFQVRPLFRIPGAGRVDLLTVRHESGGFDRFRVDLWNIVPRPLGEKDVDAAYAAGLIATCNSGGAGNWQDVLSPPLAGRDVRCVPDNDAAGARHITFGDPDFLNGPTHALRIARTLHAEFPDLTFDFTAKIEHLLKHRGLLPEFAQAGCIFIVSAVESLSDTVLAHLDKGHTRADVDAALNILRDLRVALRPSFVAFTPWTTLDDYLELLQFVESRNLIDHVDPVQFSIRLLVPPGSLLLKEAGAWLGPLNQQAFTYEWQHPDPQMDELHRQVTQIVEQAVRHSEDAAATFARICEAAYRMRGDGDFIEPLPQVAPLRLRPPRLTEAWFC